ncbi:MAG: hypothetical protein ABI672_11870 [Vicinamibacteria bacterium]
MIDTRAVMAVMILTQALSAGADELRVGQIVRVRHNGSVEAVRVVRQDAYGVLVQYKDSRRVGRNDPGW